MNERRQAIVELIKTTDLENTKIARELINSNPLFENDSFEALRKYVAEIRKEFIAYEVKKGLDIEVVEVPESRYEEPQQYELTGKIGILNDIHIPFHDKRALETAINYLIKYEPDVLYLNGDVGDFYAESKFMRDPKYRDSIIEIKAIKQFLEFVKSKFQTIYYYEGNHERRWQNYLWQNAPELASLESLNLSSVIGADDLGIKFIMNGSMVRAGKLNIIHGNEIQAGGLINVARNKLIRAFDNVIFGHHHFKDERIERSLSGQPIGAWGVGCLCGLKPEYRRINNWVHGFATVEVFNDGSFEVENKKLINYKVK